MYCVKNFTTTINIVDPINFCQNIEMHILTDLRSRFQGKCYKGCYVISIRDILNYSNCQIISTNLSSDGLINVIFSADTFVYGKWDILISVNMLKCDKVQIGQFQEQDSPVKSIVGLLQNTSQIFYVGQKIPSRVVQVLYKPGQQMNIVAIPLSCDKHVSIYNVKGNLKADAKSEITKFNELIMSEMNLREQSLKIESKRSSIWFFENLLYGYITEGSQKTEEIICKNGMKWSGPPGIKTNHKTVNLVDIMHDYDKSREYNLTGVWTRDLSIYRSSPLICKLDKIPDGSVSIEVNPRQLMIEQLKNMYDFLKAVRQLADTYDTDELVTSHMNVWAFMKQNQRKYMQ
jgi:hypothetical protein